MTSPTPPHLRQARATRATPPSGPIIVHEKRTTLVITLAVLAVAGAGAATWLGLRAQQLQRQLDQQSALMDRSVSRLSEQDKVLSTLVESDQEMQVFHLVNASTTGGITVYWNRRDGRTVLNAYGLPALPADRVYAVWLAGGLRPRLATTFVTDAKGRAVSTGIVLAGRTEMPALMVTVEPTTPGAVPNKPAVLGGEAGPGTLEEES